MILSCDDFYRGFPPNNLKYIVKISGEKKIIGSEKLVSAFFIIIKLLGGRSFISFKV